MSASILAITLASIVSLLFIILDISDRTLQSLVSIFAVVLVVTLGRKFLSTQKVSLPPWVKPALLGASSCILQILTISTGGLYSPLLILIHIFALGISFLTSLTSSMVFLTLSVAILIINILTKPTLLQIFTSDPFSAALYLISFIIIIPLSQLLAKSYYFKDAVSKVLNEYIALEESKSTSILTGLNDLVIILDPNLNITSINYAAEKNLQLNQAEVIGHPLLEVIPLKDLDGNLLSIQALSLDQALNDGTNRIMKDIKLKLKDQGQDAMVQVNIRPIADQGGRVKQMVLIINSYTKNTTAFQRHLNLVQAQTDYNLRLEKLKRNLPDYKTNQLRVEVELITHLQEDLLLSYELEDHPIVPNDSLENLLQLLEELISRKRGFTEALGISLNLTRPNFHTIQPGTNSYLTLKVDRVRLITILSKLIEICTLLCSKQPGSLVELTFGLNPPARIEIKTGYSLPENTTVVQLLSRYYPDGLGDKTNLRFGSGLEGFIAKTISTELGMELKVELSPYLKFTVIPQTRQ